MGQTQNSEKNMVEVSSLMRSQQILEDRKQMEEDRLVEPGTPQPRLPEGSSPRGQLAIQ